MSAFKKASEYRTIVLQSIQALEHEGARLTDKINLLTKKTTTAEALISGSPQDMAELRKAQQDLTIIKERLTALEMLGGLDAILSEDPRMNELADEVYQENTGQLAELEHEKDDLLKRLGDVFTIVEQLEREIMVHGGKVEQLEKEIDHFKRFMSVEIPQKISYKHKPAHFPRLYLAFFSDFKKIADVWSREGIKGGGADE